MGALGFGESVYDVYTDDSIKGELHRNLVVIDMAIGKLELKYPVELHIVGGGALMLMGLDYGYTLDIDTGNKLSDTINNLVGDLVSDNASEVISRAKDYKSRLVPYKDIELKHIEVMIFGPEDLLISKLGTGRQKDLRDVVVSGLVKQINKELLVSIIKSLPQGNKRDMVILSYKKIKKYII